MHEVGNFINFKITRSQFQAVSQFCVGKITYVVITYT